MFLKQIAVQPVPRCSIKTEFKRNTVGIKNLRVFTLLNFLPLQLLTPVCAPWLSSVISCNSWCFPIQFCSWFIRVLILYVYKRLVFSQMSHQVVSKYEIIFLLLNLKTYISPRKSTSIFSTGGRQNRTTKIAATYELIALVNVPACHLYML